MKMLALAFFRPRCALAVPAPGPRLARPATMARPKAEGRGRLCHVSIVVRAMGQPHAVC